MISELILIRHSITDANLTYTYCGSTDMPLNERGIRLVGELKEKYGYPDPEGYSLYTTGLLRTEQTLELLYGKREHEALPGMREMDFGVFEGHSYPELKNREDYQAWISGDYEANVCPGGESGNIMKRRVLAALQYLMQEEEAALVVTHGGPIAAIMDVLFPEEGKNRFEWQPDGASGYLVDFEDGRPVRWENVPFGYVPSPLPEDIDE